MHDIITVIQEMMRRCDVVGRISVIRADIEKMDVIRAEKYELFLEMALLLPDNELQDVCTQRQRSGAVGLLEQENKKLKIEISTLKSELLLARQSKKKATIDAATLAFKLLQKQRASWRQGKVSSTPMKNSQKPYNSHKHFDNTQEMF